MNKCPHCKTKLLTDHAFCPKCGYDMRPGKASIARAVTDSSQPEATLFKEQTERHTNAEQPQITLIEQQTVPYKKLRMFSYPFSFEGRIRRMEYALSFLFTVILNVIINNMSEGVEPSAITLLYIPLCWFLWAQGAKRCHDLGNSGWFQIIPFYVLMLIFADGMPGMNEYGRNPKEY